MIDFRNEDCMVGMAPGGLYRLMGGSIPRIGAETKYRLCLALDIAPRVMEEVSRR